jgi:hypothetical protein
VAAEVQNNSSESFAKIEPGMQAEFRLLDGDTSAGLWDASIFPSVKVGIEDLNLSLLKGGTWSWSEGKLSITADAFVQIPGLPLSVNRIAKFPDVAATEYTLLGDVSGSLNNKYVTIKRPSGSGYYFWFNVNGLGSDPGPFTSLSGVEVPLSTNANLITVLTSLKSAIEGSQANAYFTVTQNPSTLTIENKEAGKIILPKYLQISLVLFLTVDRIASLSLVKVMQRTLRLEEVRTSQFLERL